MASCGVRSGQIISFPWENRKESRWRKDSDVMWRYEITETGQSALLSISGFKTCPTAWLEQTNINRSERCSHKAEMAWVENNKISRTKSEE